MTILTKILAFSLLLTTCLIANAANFTSVTTIGDSAFDGGTEDTAVISAYKFQPYTLPAGYYKSKYCDGYTSAEYLAYYIGHYNVNHFFNFGVAGSVSEDLDSILDNLYEHIPVLDPTGIYVIFIGSNDVFAKNTSSEQTAINIRTAVESLHQRGARYFMVLNLPKLSGLPVFNKSATRTQNEVNFAYTSINNALKNELDGLSYTDHIAQFDMDNFSTLIGLYARNVGFTNIADGCITRTGTCNSQDTYIFWDTIHFSNKTNSFLGAFMRDKLLEVFPNGPINP